MALPTLPDYYAALGLDKDATPTSVRARYYQLARLYHPNRHQGSDEAKRSLSDHFNHIHTAWEVLSHPNQRRRYHELLELAESEHRVRRGIVDLDEAERGGRQGTEDMSPTSAIEPKWHEDNWQDPARHRKRLEYLRHKELKAFYQYQNAIFVKLEAEEEADKHQEMYDYAKWRREQFQNMPKDTSVRVRTVQRMNNVVKALRAPRPPKRGHRSTTVTYPAQLGTSGLPTGGSFLTPDSVASPVRPGHRRGYSSDISGDQESSEEDHGLHSLRSSLYRRPPRKPNLGRHIQTTSHPTSKPDPPTPEHSGSEAGPPRMFVKRPTGFSGPQIFQVVDEGVDSGSGSGSSASTIQQAPPNETTSLIQVSQYHCTKPFVSHRSNDSHAGTGARRRSPLASSDGSDIESAGTERQTTVFERRQLGHSQMSVVPMDQVLDLSESEKNRLLLVEAHSEEQAHELLSRFARLDESAAGKFMVKPNIKTSFHFRLIFSDTQAVKTRHHGFIALSYRRRLHVERREGHFTMPLEPEMFQAVLDERKNSSEGIWIDQICIDQDSDDEMTLSMSAMDMVYRSARMIVVALDDIELTAKESNVLETHMGEHTAMAHVAPNKRFRRRQPPYLETHEDVSQVIQKLLSSSWFKRAWCRHEMRLAPDHVFLVHCQSSQGTKTGSVLRFTGECLAHLLALAIEVPFEQSSEMLKPALHAFFRDRTRMRAYMGRLQHGNFTTVVAEVFAMDAGGNPRLPKEQRDADALKDKLQIVLNTMEAGLTLTAKMNSREVLPSQPECFYMLSILALAAGDPGALCTVGHPMAALKDTTLLSKASSTWLFEPTNIDAGLNNYRTLAQLPNTDVIRIERTISHTPEHFVELDMKLLGPGRIASDELPELVALAEKFVSECEVRKFGRHRKRYLIGDEQCNAVFGSMRDIYVRTLACIMLFGPHWITEICRRYHVSRWKQDLESACWLLTTLRNTNGMWPDETNNRAPWLKDAASFLLDLVNFLIIRGMPLRQIIDQETWRPVCVFSATRGKVLTFVPVEHGNVQPAIPHALLDEEYQHLARLWILERRERARPAGSRRTTEDTSITSEWTLLGKSVLFSDELAAQMVNAEGVGYQERSRVYGRLHI